MAPKQIRQFVVVSLALAVLMALAACGGHGSPTAPSTQPSTPTVPTVDQVTFVSAVPATGQKLVGDYVTIHATYALTHTDVPYYVDGTLSNDGVTDISGTGGGGGIPNPEIGGLTGSTDVDIHVWAADYQSSHYIILKLKNFKTQEVLATTVQRWDLSR